MTSPTSKNHLAELWAQYTLGMDAAAEIFEKPEEPVKVEKPVDLGKWGMDGNDNRV